MTEPKPERKQPDEAVTCPKCYDWAKRHHTEDTFICENCGWEGESKLIPLRIIRNL